MGSPLQSPQEFASRQYDYLIVGGGSAGLAVANRLSEIPNFTVGIIEAGPVVAEDPMIDQPGHFVKLLDYKYDWDFRTLPQPAMDGNSIHIHRGKLLGGSSAKNFLVWNRGGREDYDAWEKLGNPGWGWDDMLPFFKKSETYAKATPLYAHRSEGRNLDDFHGADGPIQVSRMQECGPTPQYWHEAMNNMGIKANPDGNAGENTGAFKMPYTIEPSTSSRSSSYRGYYVPVAQRPNLHLLTEAMVEEIILENHGEQWLARGVRVNCNNETLIVHASREVIVCAGTIQSPQLLEVSGIGNPKFLEPAGVQLKVHNPNVGEHYRDHLTTQIVFELLPSIANLEDLNGSTDLQVANLLNKDDSPTGINTVLPSCLAYCPLDKIFPPEELAQLAEKAERLAQEPGKDREKLLAKRFDAEKGALGQIEYMLCLQNCTPYFQGEPGKKYASLNHFLLYPFGRGSIHLPPMRDGRRTTTNDQPMIDPQFYMGLEGEIDREVMKNVQRYGDKILATDPLRQIVAKRVFPPVEIADGKDKLEDASLNYTITTWHPMGTCSMGGTAGRNGGVVDERLRVYGVKGLRVADASIFPLPVGAHIISTVYAVAEKAASMVVEDAGIKRS